MTRASLDFKVVDSGFFWPFWPREVGWLAGKKIQGESMPFFFPATWPLWQEKFFLAPRQIFFIFFTDFISSLADVRILSHH